jgi:hypothetical protein
MRNLARPFLLAPCLILPGCSYPPPDFDSPDPGARLYAITDAARTDNKASIPALIASLDSDDPAVRMFAIRTLEKFTGQTLGYDHAAPEWERKPAVDRWINWYQSQPGSKEAIPGSAEAQP